MREAMAAYNRMTPAEREQWLRESERDAAERRERQRQDDAAAERARLLRPLLDSIGERYHGCTFDNYEIYDPHQNHVVDQLRYLAANIGEWVRAGRGLILYGPAGTGKDHLAAALMLHAARERGIRCIGLQGRSFPYLSYEQAGQMIAYYARPELAVVTIIDPGPTTKFQTDFLGDLLNTRYCRRLSTWLTVNARTKEDGQTLLGTAIFDRFVHDARTFYCDWPSFRERSCRKAATTDIPAGAAGGP